MINSIQTFQTADKSRTVVSPSFKGGFERLEEGLFSTGGMSVWNDKTQKMISRSMSKENLEKLMNLMEQTENERILFCDIGRCGIFKKRLKAHFGCTYFLNNFTENFKQRPLIESKRGFLMRMLDQFNKYKKQLTDNGVKWK